MAPRSPDLTPADFWLWGYLKSRVYLSGSSSLLELKDAIRREVSSIHPDMLHSAVAGFVTRLECLLPCGGGHVEHILVRLRSRTNRRCAKHGSFNFRNRQTASIFKVDSVKSIPRIHGWWTKSLRSGKLKKEHLALMAPAERRLRRIVRRQRSQTLAQITTQLNDGASSTVSKRTVQRSLHGMGFGSRRPTRVPLLNARHRPGQESTETGV
ncbi:HTH_Tnp_Tc3_2 domain-containing protein [Trichonephila clavipes]|nr:HTH_Tnp_Tc3_2 domain-containing protein [Trichonephila clavipes]